ncbi:unnamed protein product [Spodoptera exigua]|nr:unnamed protein product [Spodoptera exigua]
MNDNIHDDKRKKIKYLENYRNIMHIPTVTEALDRSYYSELELFESKYSSYKTTRHKKPYSIDSVDDEVIRKSESKKPSRLKIDNYRSKVEENYREPSEELFYDKRTYPKKQTNKKLYLTKSNEYAEDWQDYETTAHPTEKYVFNGLYFADSETGKFEEPATELAQNRKTLPSEKKPYKDKKSSKSYSVEREKNTQTFNELFSYRKTISTENHFRKSGFEERNKFVSPKSDIPNYRKTKPPIYLKSNKSREFYATDRGHSENNIQIELVPFQEDSNLEKFYNTSDDRSTKTPYKMTNYKTPYFIELDELRRVYSTNKPHQGIVYSTNRLHQSGVYSTNTPHQSEVYSTQRQHQIQVYSTQRRHQGEAYSTQRPHQSEVYSTYRPHQGEAYSTQRPHQSEVYSTYRPHQGEAYSTQRPHQSEVYSTYRPHQGEVYSTQRPHQSEVYSTYRPHQGEVYSTYRPHQGEVYSNDKPHYEGAYSTNRPQHVAVYPSHRPYHGESYSNVRLHFEGGDYSSDKPHPEEVSSTDRPHYEGAYSTNRPHHEKGYSTDKPFNEPFTEYQKPYPMHMKDYDENPSDIFQSFKPVSSADVPFHINLLDPTPTISAESDARRSGSGRTASYPCPPYADPCSLSSRTLNNWYERRIPQVVGKKIDAIVRYCK